MYVIGIESINSFSAYPRFPFSCVLVFACKSKGMSKRCGGAVVLMYTSSAPSRVLSRIIVLIVLQERLLQ